MVTEVNKELTAIGEVVKALEPLDPESRARVVDYVFKLLGIKVLGAERPQTSREESAHRPATDVSQLPTKPEFPAIDIRHLKEQKDPQSAIEMAALVAYYLQENAPVNQRRDYITAEDIKSYFKQAKYPSSPRPGMTLTNAKNAGYFDSAGGGQYKLNAVGYNLVAYGLRQKGASEPPRKRVATKKKTSKGKKTPKS